MGEKILRIMKLMHIPFIYLLHISSNHMFDYTCLRVIPFELRLEKHLTVVKDETDSK